jgi:hypothetical protein
MLPQHASELWNRYVAAESDRIHSELLCALDAFIEGLTAVSDEVRLEWARRFAADHVDAESSFPIRIPLFRRVLFPALASGLESQTPGCARWLGHLWQLLFQCPDLHARITPPNATPEQLFRTALLHDPQDSKARGALIELLAWELEFSIHEVPWAVVTRTGSSTAEGLAELRRNLDEFAALTQQHGSHENYAALLRACTFHFREYESYLAQRAAFANYEAYLTETHPAGWPDS